MSLRPNTKTMLRKMKAIKHKIATMNGATSLPMSKTASRPSRMMLAHTLKANRLLRGSKAARGTIIGANLRKKKHWDMVEHLHRNA